MTNGDWVEGVWVGVDIGGTKTAIVLASDPPEVLLRVEFPTLPEQGPKRVLELIPKTIDRMVHAHGASRSSLKAIGVSCGGPLDRVAGVIQAPPNLATWQEIPIRKILEQEFRIDCRLENDANAGAVAELRFGAGQRTQNMVFLTMGTGLGAGIIANGHLYRGASDLAGEIGHVRLTESGPLGHNKPGSVEGWASGGGMAEAAGREVAAAMKRGDTTLLTAVVRQNRILTAKDVAEAAQQGDELAKRIVQSTGTRLGEALAILVDVLNPELIVVGGLAMRLRERLLGPAQTAMKREALGASARACRIVPAALGERIGDVAAICVAMGVD